MLLMLLTHQTVLVAKRVLLSNFVDASHVVVVMIYVAVVVEAKRGMMLFASFVLFNLIVV